MSTQAQIDANRKNAQNSSGPRTDAGKAASSLNAVTHGFTGTALLLTAAEKKAFEAFRESMLQHYDPKTPAEEATALSAIQTKFRIGQIQTTESGVYAIGRMQFAEQFSQLPEEEADPLIRAFTYRANAKELDRLHRYENRLTRQYEKEIAQLEQMQAARKALEAEKEAEMIRLHTYHKNAGKTWNPSEFGFVLSTAEIEARIERRKMLEEGSKTCKAA